MRIFLRLIYINGFLKGLVKIYLNNDIFFGYLVISLMIVVRMFCYKGWKLGYNGYLMVGYYKYNVGIMYRCVDYNLESLFGDGNIDSNGYLLYWWREDVIYGSVYCMLMVKKLLVLCFV